MKDDAPTPAQVPRKRRHVEAALDKWLAEWLARPNLTPSVRRLLEGEKERRKLARKRGPDITVGVLIGGEGLTPEQAEFVAGYLLTATPEAVVSTGLPAKLARRLDGIPLADVPDYQAVVRSADVVLAAPRGSEARGTGVVEAIRYAKHRRVPVRIVLPNGMEGV